MVGAALALDREGVWGLSLLVVLPDHQSLGVGRALLERSLEYAGGGERGGIILASPTRGRCGPTARAGFEAHPSFGASGHRARSRRRRPPCARATRATSRSPRRSTGPSAAPPTAATSRPTCAPARRCSSSRARVRAARRNGRSSCSPRSTRRPPATLLQRRARRGARRRETHVEWITAAQQWAVGRRARRGAGARSPAGRCTCAATWGRSGPTSRAGRTCSRYGFRTVAFQGGHPSPWQNSPAPWPERWPSSPAAAAASARRSRARWPARASRVAIGDLDGAVAEQAAAELGGGAIGLALDVTDRPAFTACLDEVEQRARPDRRDRQQRRDHAGRPVRGGDATRPRSASSSSTSTPSSTAPRRRCGG